MPYLQVNGAKIYYEVSGSGPAVVFTHGHSMNHKQWHPQIEALAENYQTITWDVRGHGHSTLPPGEVNPRDFSKDLNALLNHLQIRNAVLCGLSMGGHISIQTAAYYPEKVKGLILIGTPFTNRFNWFEKYGAPFSKLSLRILPYSWTKELTASILSKFNPSNKSYVRESFSQINKADFLRHWSGNLKMESTHLLDHITCPTLILHGDQDKMVARQQSLLKSAIKGSEFKTISNADHLTNLDNPTEVTEVIHSFLISHHSSD
ncbi:alpha/beta fold hydrolase [Alkalicoccobacillus porphyridii]|uniref:Alpha/beta hydrolase n=1 Tax=Alkalicoccobacillus porphyridii TaxID=2597270 RepID=A0A553ZX09_9BACI|nr:alpha/beta hydrolase [Alkalicoccobacillus porphyridii]TSB45998.1 alpha/beta hydrolase [Alkalicoccobacillus porphyridii]